MSCRLDDCPGAALGVRALEDPGADEVPLGAEIKSSFREITTPLVVTRAGSGSGAVTSMPAGIDCGATCTAAFQEESTVTLTPEAAAGSSFAGWSGACSGTGACTVTIGEQRVGFLQILDGVQVCELAATDGASFLSNMLAIAGTQ